MTETQLNRVVRGYQLIVPEEWQRIPVQSGTDRAIESILDRALAKQGRDEVAQYRRELQTRLKNLARQARENGAVDLYLPVGHRERNLPASFLVSFVEFGKPDAPPSGAVLAEVLSTTDGAKAVELDGAHGMRTDKIYPPDSSRGVDYPSRRVEYIMAVPGTADSWLVSSFSTVGGENADDQISELLCSLFDAIMSTFRWQYAQEAS